jgi:acetylornithine deacetylase/succinyl-diaminopimelate desuccinylase-like protein
VGDMVFEPGAYNIVPQRVTLALEFRSPEAGQFARLEESLLALACSSAEQYGLGLEVEFQGRHQPAPMSLTVQQAYETACDRLGLSHKQLPSFAGHDPQSLADVCPVGMVFVPSVGGTSHAPGEFTEWPDCINGANVLLHAVLVLAESGGEP